MSSILPKHWLPIVEKFLTLGLVFERQRVSAEFDSEKFNAGWDEFMRHAHEIEEILRKEPKGGWPKTLTRFKEFGQGVSRFLATYHDGSRPELVAEALTTCISKAETVMVCELMVPTVELQTVEEPNPKKGAGGRRKILTERKFKAYAKKFPGKLALVTLKELSKYWGVAKSTIARHGWWKSIRREKKVAREEALERCDPKTEKGITRAAKRGKDRQEEVEEERDRKLDRF